MTFHFAFNDPKYSDRKLRLIIGYENCEEDINQEDEEETRRLHKRRRCNPDGCDISIAVSGEPCEEFYVNTLLLAKESQYFRRIFDGECFKESSEKVIDIHLLPEEKEPFLDFLRYMYTNKLEASTVDKLVGVWLLAQRFLVESCVDLCMQKLKFLPLSLASSCYFLESAAVVNQTNDFKDLMGKSITFLVNHFQVSMVMNGENPGRWANFEDFKQLRAAVLDFLLSSDELQVVHEESVVYALRAWISVNCNTSMQEADAWKRFGPLIRWPAIETMRLNTLLGKSESENYRDLVIEALLHKISSDEEKDKKDAIPHCSRFRRRLRHAVPVKFISINSPINHGFVFFNLSMKEWAYLQQLSGPVCTERFFLGGCIFIWLIQVRNFEVKRRVSILLVALNAPPSSLRVDISLSIWDARDSAYIQRYKGVHSLRKDVRERIAMCLDCFGRDLDNIVPDSEFIFKDATWFKTELQVDRADQLS